MTVKCKANLHSFHDVVTLVRNVEIFTVFEYFSHSLQKAQWLVEHNWKGYFGQLFADAVLQNTPQTNFVPRHHPGRQTFPKEITYTKKYRNVNERFETVPSDRKVDSYSHIYLGTHNLILLMPPH